jgi:GT2 family glycosyltransferase
VWPKVSVIIVAYNKAQFTAAAVHSVLTLSDYENLEVIVVDNASADDTQSVLRQFAEDKRFRMIRLEENAGFAGGNNIGMKAATGDVFILLNNDTFVTKGWVRDLIRPLLLNHTIGLSGPLTNRIGNEQQVQISYDNMSAMAVEARRVTRRYSRRLFEVRSVAFFCVALRRDLYENVGKLDEKYGIGFFEDDDYCMRAAKAGYRSVIVDDVFVHHHLSASFADFGDERRRILMERNRKIYEEAWGPWPGHQYRDEPGFGV